MRLINKLIPVKFATQYAMQSHVCVCWYLLFCWLEIFLASGFNKFITIFMRRSNSKKMSVDARQHSLYGEPDQVTLLGVFMAIEAPQI